MPRHPKQHHADEELAINLDARDEAMSDLRDAARRAGAAIEPLLRWSMQLQSDPPAAIRNMRKVLATTDGDNVILMHMAEKVLGALAPEAIGETATHRRKKAKQHAERQLRHEVELLRRRGWKEFPFTITADEQEVRNHIADAMDRFLDGPRTRTARPGNVVTFGKLDGDLPPGAA